MKVSFASLFRCSKVSVVGLFSWEIPFMQLLPHTSHVGNIDLDSQDVIFCADLFSSCLKRVSFLGPIVMGDHV